MSFENQRQPDLGNGTYLNPILGGDFPDPSVARVGDDYYLTNSSFNYAPGLLIWHSRDLVNWEPVANALPEHDGDVWAPDICHHDGTFTIYYPTSASNHVVTATNIAGPWSKPVDLKVGEIDPGHVVAPDGTRYLHLSSGKAAELTPDGLAIASGVRRVYDGWPIPSDWSIEGFCLEGPKLFRRGDYYYLLSAQGGTAGPATSHMVVAARSNGPLGPWENSPHNPVIHTASRDERWWSVGHGTILDTPAGEWWMMVHAYEKGFHTLGRQTLLVPVEWAEDGWPVVPSDFDAARPYRKPQGGSAVPHGMPLSDDFTGPGLGLQWRWWGEARRGCCSIESGTLKVAAAGTGPSDCGPLACIPVDRAYEAEVDVEIEREADAGLCLFYNPACYVGVALSGDQFKVVRHTNDFSARDGQFRRGSLKIRNEHHEVTLSFRPEGGDWEKTDPAYEVSGYNHNVFGAFLSLRLALFASGTGRAHFHDFRYRAL